MAPLPLLALVLSLPVDAATLDAREQALHDSLWQEFLAAEAPGLPAEGERPACLTHLVMELKANWRVFGPAEQARMAAALNPFGGTGLGPVNHRGQDDDKPPPPAPLEDEPCWGHQSSNYMLTEHFSVEWDSGVSESLAESFAEALEYSWDQEVEEFGWNQPVGTDQYPMLAYISDDSGNAGAYTSVESCSGVGYAPYIVASSGSWSSSSWADTMAAHEFHHTIQFSTSYAPEFWYWEASAIWMEEQVYPQHNWWTYYVSAYTDTPYIGLTASSQRDYEIFYHMYGAAIFNFFLDNWYEGADTVKAMWDEAEFEYGQYSYFVKDNVEDIGLDWDEVWTGFMAATAVMDYDEQSAFPGIDIHDYVNSLPDAGESTSRDEPQSLGLNYIQFPESLDSGGGDLHVSFSGEAGPEWYAVLVSTEDDRVAEVLRLELDEANSGEGWIPFQDGDVFLAVSPYDDDASGYYYDWDNPDSWSYSWTAELGENPDGEQPEDTGYDGIDDPPDRPDDDIGPPSCGCSARSQGAGAGGLALLAMLAGLVIRRRR